MLQDVGQNLLRLHLQSDGKFVVEETLGLLEEMLVHEIKALAAGLFYTEK